MPLYGRWKAIASVCVAGRAHVSSGLFVVGMVPPFREPARSVAHGLRSCSPVAHYGSHRYQVGLPIGQTIYVQKDSMHSFHDIASTLSGPVPGGTHRCAQKTGEHARVLRPIQRLALISAGITERWPHVAAGAAS